MAKKAAARMYHGSTMMRLRAAIGFLVAVCIRLAKHLARPGGGPKFVFG